MRRYGMLLLAAVLVAGYFVGVNPATIDAPVTVTLTVSPLETSGTSTGTLTYTIGATSDVTLDASTESGSNWPAGSTLTVDPTSVGGGGSGNTLDISKNTSSGTLLDNLTKTGNEYSASLDFSASKVSWNQPAGSYDLTLTYKLVSS